MLPGNKRKTVSRYRVVHFGKYYPPVPGGIERHLEDLAVGLAADFDIEVIASNTSFRSTAEETDDVRLQRLGRAATFLNSPICPRILASAKRSGNADIVHLHYPNPAAEAALNIFKPRGKIVVSYHADVMAYPALAGLYWRLISRPLFNRAAAIFIGSDRMLKTSPRLSSYVAKCTTTSYGINLDDYETNTERRARAYEIRKKAGKPIVLFVGRLTGYKGLDILVRAFQRIDGGKLYIAGTGKLEKQLKRLARKLNVIEKVVFCGGLERADLTGLYAAAEMLVLPSTTAAEQFGIVQLEAMASGTPIINTDLPSSVPTVSIDGETGITVPPGDEKALAKAVNLLLADGKLREKLGRAGMKRVEANFTNKKVVLRVAEVYWRLLRSS